ncbi:MAG: MarR family transcriptional regulator [Hyphomicrobiales bacterium]|nr:MarR family transcriptional regulator [Hyphomicrobiales bacterium]MBV8662623.1 MarR family transcriptional regulator [Hyphomicrobiales bacterium]
MTRPKASRPTVPAAARTLTQGDYETLAEFRYLIRCFLEFSQDAAREVGLAPQQHQALLAIRGFPGGRALTIGDLAERLRIRHQTAVELVDRLAEGGLAARTPDPNDHRRILVGLTERANDLLAQLGAVHLDELARIKPSLKKILS